MFRSKPIVQIICLGSGLFLFFIVFVGCRPQGHSPGDQDAIIDEVNQTSMTQSVATIVTATINTTTSTSQPSSTSVSPTITSTPMPAPVEPTVEATSIFTPTPGFHTERVFDFGGERRYDFWGDRVAISSDEKWLVVATVNQELGSDGDTNSRWEEVRVYDYEMGQQQHVLQRTESAETYSAMAFSPDDQWVAIGATNRLIWVWDVAGGELVQQFTFRGPISDLAFSPNGSLLAVVSPSEDPREHGVAVYDTKSGSLVADKQDIIATSVTFLGNGEQLLVGAAVYPHPNREIEDSLFIWDRAANTTSSLLSQYGEPRVMVIDKERGLLATVIERRLYLIDLQNDTELDIGTPEVSVRTLRFDSAGNIWTLGFDGLLSQWNTNGEVIRQQPYDDATDFIVLPTNSHLLIVFPDELWEVRVDE